jgi:putative oxidoreductase
MLGAIFTVHLKNGLFMNWYGKQAGEGFEYHILAIALFLIILIVGPGQIAASRFLKLPKFAE